ncbi:SET family sugar efflux transporter-like MFS transporter [Actinoplanes campanulatus]|uniref:SET family sugar efflux transporter-like MFS transporter n=1 Tax=Actinoplanes campanulatus TaxID=113559 RepID=A0A7W5AHL3_9ACTN|nr:MFS transporter [Actinoplanes campanulatus]MBB3096240.1 SET family sugar efflux transporter-like MFS transporter [Actinoplanes campanulatus]
MSMSLAVAVLLLGVADSMVGSYFVLFVTDVTGISPWQTGVFVSVHGVGGILLSWLAGRGFDRRPSRGYAAAAMLSGGLALCLMTVITSFPLLILLAVTLLGALAAAFPQLFALARTLPGGGPAARRSVPLLRSVWSLAWALGPLLGTAVLATAGHAAIPRYAGAVLAVAAAWVLAAVPAPCHDPPGGAPAGAPAGGPLSRTATVLLTLGITLFFTAMFAGSVAMPLFVTRELHQPYSAVGVLFSVCAAVEVVAALALAAVPGHVSQPLLILAGMGCFVFFFALTVLAGGLPLLVAGQVVRGVAVAVVGAAGIRYFQDVMAPATGRATTLFANATTAGMVIAGIVAGGAVEILGYTGTLLLCGGVTVAAAVAFALGTASRVRRPRLPVRSPAAAPPRGATPRRVPDPNR